MFGRALERFISLTTLAAVVFLAVSAVVLLGIAIFILLRPFLSQSFATEDVLLAIGLAVVSVGVADLALTVNREETDRRANPRNAVITTEIVTRFLFVVVVSLAIDNLFSVVRSEIQENAQRLLISGALVISTSVLLIATGYYYSQTRPRKSEDKAGLAGPDQAAEPPSAQAGPGH